MRPSLRANLEHRAGLRRVPMSWAFHVAELNLVRRFGRADRDRERNLQHLVTLMPVDLRFETQYAPVEYHALPQLRLAATSHEPHGDRVQVHGLEVGDRLERLQLAEV